MEVNGMDYWWKKAKHNEKRLGEALDILEKIYPTVSCDAEFSGDCTACDLGDFIRVASEEIGRKCKT
jgi:hypothetical protein